MDVVAIEKDPLATTFGSSGTPWPGRWSETGAITLIWRIWRATFSASDDVRCSARRVYMPPRPLHDRVTCPRAAPTPAPQIVFLPRPERQLLRNIPYSIGLQYAVAHCPAGFQRVATPNARIACCPLRLSASGQPGPASSSVLSSNIRSHPWLFAAVCLLIAGLIVMAVMAPVCIIHGCPPKDNDSGLDDLPPGITRLLVHFSDDLIDALDVIPAILHEYIERLLLDSSRIQILNFLDEDVLQEARIYLQDEASLDLLTRDFLFSEPIGSSNNAGTQLEADPSLPFGGYWGDEYATYCTGIRPSQLTLVPVPPRLLRPPSTNRNWKLDDDAPALHMDPFAAQLVPAANSSGRLLIHTSRGSTNHATVPQVSGRWSDSSAAWNEAGALVTDAA
eukprot:gene12855-3568_t